MRRRIELLFTRIDLQMRNGNLDELIRNSTDICAEKTGRIYANGTALIATIENSELQLGREVTIEMIGERLEEGAVLKDETESGGDPR
jgi:hypothetical protein